MRHRASCPDRLRPQRATIERRRVVFTYGTAVIVTRCIRCDAADIDIPREG